MTRDHHSAATPRSDQEETIGGSDDRVPPTVSGAPGDRWLVGEQVLEADLPEDVAVLLGRLLGGDPVETLDEWVAEVRRHTGGSIDVEELCHADADSPHRGELDGGTYGFRCFYDAVILAALVEEPVDVRTESPEGAVIEAEAVGTDDLRVTPEEAVFSFGIDEGVEPPGEDGPSDGGVYSAVCPYVLAFPDAEAYEVWAESISAATVALPLAGATDVAEALVE